MEEKIFGLICIKILKEILYINNYNEYYFGPLRVNKILIKVTIVAFIKLKKLFLFKVSNMFSSFNNRIRCQRYGVYPFLN